MGSWKICDGPLSNRIWHRFENHWRFTDLKKAWILELFLVLYRLNPSQRKYSIKAWSIRRHQLVSIWTISNLPILQITELRQELYEEIRHRRRLRWVYDSIRGLNWNNSCSLRRLGCFKLNWRGPISCYSILFFCLYTLFEYLLYDRSY